MIGFWIFMVIMVLTVPVTMIGFGSRFSRKAPEKINCVFGYRTARSMRNMDTWTFAHKYFGRLWKWVGWAMLPLSAVPMFFVFAYDAAVVGTVGGIIVALQLIPLAATIFPTERALKKRFDEFGRRR